MRKSIRLLLTIAFGMIPLCGFAQGPSDILHKQLISQSTTENVELLIPTVDLPPGLSNASTTVTYRFVLLGNPYTDHIVETDASEGGFVKFTIKVGPDTGNGRKLLVNDAELCCAIEDAGRVAYQISVQAGMTRGFLSGGEFPVPTTADENQSGVSIAIAHVDATTHETHSYIMRPVIFAPAWRSD